MERPAIPPKDHRSGGHVEHDSPLRPFPDYGTTNFMSCVATLDGTGSAVEQTLLSPEFIRMYEIRSNPPRTAYISMPKRIDHTSFNVRYGGFPD
jgi:hypothetical protein